MQFANVLVALDDSQTSDRVFDVAVSLVKLSGGRLLIVHVVSTPVSFSVDPHLGGGQPDIINLAGQIEKRGKELLEKYAMRAAAEYQAGSTPSSLISTVETILVRGDAPVEAIIREAESKSADLIVVGSKGFGGAKGFFLGSVPNSVLHDSKIPVLLVK